MTVSPYCPWCGATRSESPPHGATLHEPRLFQPGARRAVRVETADALAELVTPPLVGLDREHCLLVALDTKHHVLALRTVSIGSVDQTFMQPREVFRDALLAGAAAIAVAHNHPSGDPEPSADDRSVTRRLARAAELLGVALLDHIVVGGPGRWRSMGRMGLL